MAFKMGGWSLFSKKKKKEYEPQTQYRGYKSHVKKGHHTHLDLTPQTQLHKMDSDYIEGHIEGKFDNEYFEALQSGDKGRVRKQENQMLRYKKELDDRGVKYTHVDMTDFGKKKKKRTMVKNMKKVKGSKGMTEAGWRGIKGEIKEEIKGSKGMTKVKGGKGMTKVKGNKGMIKVKGKKKI